MGLGMILGMRVYFDSDSSCVLVVFVLVGLLILWLEKMSRGCVKKRLC